MNTALLLGVAIGVSAPALKDPPPKLEPIVGEWEIESVTMDGKRATSRVGIRYEFTADGQRISKSDRGDKPRSVKYKVDPKADPLAIDLIGPTDGAADRGIFRVEGHRMVFCFSFDSDTRPTKFESPAGSRLILMVLKRVNPKE